ncbi:MAG: multidrug efflux MFS transporter [Lactobacillaceae bacterium]|jgi:DHA1 family multidrug resistance protein-like MFS transporter|nr:multidrug efflux MFS transporter [Lactobacillaceae bacterium]
MKKTEGWKRNLFVLWFGTFMTGIAFSEVMPFLSLYVDQLGDFSKQELTIYSSIAFSITFLTTAIVSPWWGKLADKYGRKPMLLRSSIGMALVMGSMGFVTNVYWLIFLRALQGALGGYISNANAFIATNSPKEQSGKSLSILVTGITAGNLLGPFIGGTIASIFSYRQTFFVTGSILILVFILTLFFVHEDFTPFEKKAGTSSKEIWSKLPNKQLIISVFVTTVIVQMVNTSINPFVALFVRELTHNATHTAFIAGVVAAMPGFATIIAATYFGKLGDRIGNIKILTYGFIFAFLVQFPTSFVTSVTALMFFRFLIGISDAAMVPQLNTLLAKNTPHEMTSRIFSYNQSFMSIGNILGPALGTIIANIFDYRGVFMAGSILILLNFILFKFNQRKINKTL